MLSSDMANSSRVGLIARVSTRRVPQFLINFDGTIYQAIDLAEAALMSMMSRAASRIASSRSCETTTT